MHNPWETGDTYCGHRCAWQDVQSRIDAAKTMPAARLRACLAWPGTQKTVRQWIERRLRKISATPPANEENKGRTP